MGKTIFYHAASLAIQYFTSIIMIIVVGCLPILLQGLAFNVEEYFASIQKLAVNMLTMKDLTFDGTHSIFPGVFDRYVLSLKLMVLSIISVITLSFLVSYSVVLIFKKQKKYILNGIEILRSLPDLVSIFLLQLFFIWVTKMTGIKLVQAVSLGSENQAVFLPVVCLSLPLFFYMTQILVYRIFSELDKNYAQFAKAKGLSSLNILNVHILQNIWQDLLGHFRTIVWMMLSTLVIVEYLFNVNGLMMYNLSHIYPDLFVFSCILLFTPFFILFRLIDWLYHIEN